MKKNLTHKDLIDFLKKFEDFKYVNTYEQISIKDMASIDTNDINKSVHLIGNFFNQPTGSAGNYDLYKLLQVYFKDEVKRTEINDIIKN